MLIQLHYIIKIKYTVQVIQNNYVLPGKVTIKNRKKTHPHGIKNKIKAKQPALVLSEIITK